MQQMYGDSFVEVINLKDFNLSPEKNNNDMTDNIDSNVFLGESSIPHVQYTPKKSYSSVPLDQKIKRLTEKVESKNFNIDNICQEIADFFVDSSWDQNESILAEAYAESQNGSSKEIIIREKSNLKVADTPECFYEYVQNNAGEFKPYLKFKENSSNSAVEQPQEKKRGRPRKKPLTEDEDNQSFEERMNRAGIRTKLDMSNILMMIHKPQAIVILQTAYGTKLGYVEIAEKEQVDQYNLNAQLSTIIGRIVSVGNNASQSQEEILARIVRMIIKKIIEQSSQKHNKDGKKDIDKVLNSLSPDVYNTIKKLVIETDKNNPKRSTFKRLKARFIPIDRMFQFTIPSPDYYPYGLSFIDPLVLQGVR